MALARAAAVPRPVCLFRAAPAQRFSSPAAVTAATAPPPPPDGGGGTGPRVLRVLLVGSPVAFSSLRPFDPSPHPRPLSPPAVTGFCAGARVLSFASPAQGAGKGTQSARIRNKFPFVAISSGDVLRKHIQSGTDVGRLAHEAMLKGGGPTGLLPGTKKEHTGLRSLVPTIMLKEMVSDNVMRGFTSSPRYLALTGRWCVRSLRLDPDRIGTRLQQHLLLDGFPRSMEQAKALDDKLDRDCQPLNLVINLHVPTDVILQRIMGEEPGSDVGVLEIEAGHRGNSERPVRRLMAAFVFVRAAPSLL
ncbi:MAG: hypothetical protein BJ554DRAFT_5528 [Olpidium bornovanus]|uniref:Adenylate kinase n=1 Tax=Olpidium bornovanus TaxID=278681 RepID=A0A8H7ZZG7_9FUNG|nr:MAG: hypothetical protein BJ554DRAFT_5528 [Olpidium bornovanus]